jgi:hypothetical protein
LLFGEPPLDFSLLIEVVDMAEALEWLLDRLLLNNLEVRDSWDPSVAWSVEFRGMVGSAGCNLGS